jgi:hypothetical protein
MFDWPKALAGIDASCDLDLAGTMDGSSNV